MSPSAGRAFSGFTSRVLGRGMRIKNASASVGLRSLSLTSPAPARSKPPSDDEAVNSEPIKFSTSKASHRTWRVDRSLGSQHERPWWKVLPVSLAFTAFLLWCILRPETDIDTQLEKQLYERLPGLTSDEEESRKE
ncbi:ubiquinol-cytochrome-c reductase complex assembly factor 4 [Poeciliopsis prolifica]|uniref:ubiquinol-cytochrome-c reductase complex assembly factor 4 n=1 Tax=Poeciliopsis prolifica TaxID=188132 RepID=UPI0024140F4B|nr:ubiquinol-cytochrome-c reductase complex assembly factor 4 [Poeciliopsis prolifica]